MQWPNRLFVDASLVMGLNVGVRLVLGLNVGIEQGFFMLA